jgi:hypothetical protein
MGAITRENLRPHILLERYEYFDLSHSNKMWGRKVLDLNRNIDGNFQEVGVGSAQWGITGDKLEPREPVAFEPPVGDVTRENLTTF